MIVIALLGFSMANAEDKPNLKTSTETFQDWQVACVEQKNVKRCEMKQTLVNQNQQPLAVLSLAKNKKNELMMLVRFILEK